jgi:choline kinase
MRAIILSAGQGKRLHPLTEETPKCLLPVRGEQPLLEVQLRALAEAGVEEAVVLVGFGASQVEEFVANRAANGIRVTTIFNPFFAVSDNLATCWLAREWMQGEFLILNGDTLFEPAVARRLLASVEAPLTLAVNEKDAYDDDDMKVSLRDGKRLVAVGKTLDARIVDAESIGLMLFRADGARAFNEVLEHAMRHPEAVNQWYLSSVNELAQTTEVSTLPITGLWWGEVDSPEDLAFVRASLDDDEKEDQDGTRVHRAQFATS